jgi:hypothetical protein
MPVEIANVIHAMAAVDASDTGASFIINRGFSSVTRMAIGTYTLTLDQPIEADESLVKVEDRSRGTDGNLPVGFHTESSQTSGGTIRTITIQDSFGSLVDRDFDIIIFAVPIT